MYTDIELKAEDLRIKERKNLRLELEDYVDELIDKHHMKRAIDVDLSDLEESEKQKFASYLIQSDNQYSASTEFIDPAHILIFANYLTTSDPEDHERFIHAMKKQSVDYYEETMKDMLSERAMKIFNDEADDNGMRVDNDRQTGELIICRR